MKPIAIVTGALRGLGKETARQLAERGMHVIMTGRDAQRGTELTREFAGLGLEVEFMVLDVSSVASIEVFAKAIAERHGHLDVLVNNAGILIDDQVTPASSLQEQSSMILKTFETNTLGAYLVSRAMLAMLQKSKSGRIVNVSSGMGQLSEMNGGYVGYRLSKTALNAVTRILADETKGTNICVNSVCPGWVKTDMGGSGAELEVSQGVETIVWLATVTGARRTGGFYREKEQIPW